MAGERASELKGVKSPIELAEEGVRGCPGDEL